MLGGAFRKLIGPRFPGWNSMRDNAGLRPLVGRDLSHKVHGSRSVAGGGDVGTERTQH